MTRHSILAGVIACLLAGPASAGAGYKGIVDLLDHRCAGIASKLQDASAGHRRCLMSKLEGLDTPDRSDVQIAGLALQACEAEQGPVRGLIGQCAGDDADAAMDDYQGFALSYLVSALVRGSEAEIGKRTVGETVIADGPAFEALVDHLTCMSLAGFTVAEQTSDQDAAVAQATRQCQDSAAALATAIAAGFKPEDVEGARRYAQIEAATQVAMELEARYGPPGEVDGQAAGEANEIDTLLAERCGGSMEPLGRLMAAHIQCGEAAIGTFGDGTRSDSEAAALALAACAAKQAPVREVLGQCGGDAADRMMRSYQDYALNDLVKRAVQRAQMAVITRASPASAIPTEGPVFAALVDHLACVSIAAYAAAAHQADRAAALAEADTTCEATARAFAKAVTANLTAKDAVPALEYVRAAVPEVAGREFDARTRERAKAR